MKQTFTKLWGGVICALLLVPSVAVAVDYPVTAKWDFENNLPEGIVSTGYQGGAVTHELASTVSGITMYVDARNGKFSTNGATSAPALCQMNANTILRIPVNSITDVVSTKANTQNYTIGGAAVTSNTPIYSATLADVANGYVEIVGTNFTQFSNLQVVQNERGDTPYLLSFTANESTYNAGDINWSVSGNTFSKEIEIAGTLISESNPLTDVVVYTGTPTISYSGNTAIIEITKDAVTYTYNITFAAPTTRTVTYYDVDGTSSLGTQDVTFGSVIGTFAYTANITSGNTFRGWYTAANGAGTKVTTSTIVDDNMSIYAYQTETETSGPDKSYTFDLRTVANADYFADHEAISISGGNRNGAQHGWGFTSSQSISILIAGNSKITIGLCTYSGGNITITYPNGNTASCAADPDPDGITKDGEEYTFVYSGGTSGVATISFSGNTYVHLIKIANSYGIVEVGNTGWATYITNEDVDFSGVTAYIVSSKTASSATLTEVASAPAGTPVLINASEGEHILTSEASPVDVSDNKLQAATNAVTADGTQYILANGGSGIGFYKAKSGTTIAAGKAYLSSSAGSPALTFVFEGGTTGITDVKNSNTVSGFNFFNLKGQRVDQPTKGLYIVNGKKVIIK